MSTTKRKAGARKEAAPAKKSKDKEPAKRAKAAAEPVAKRAPAEPVAKRAPAKGGGAKKAAGRPLAKKQTANDTTQLALPLDQARSITRDGMRGDVAELLDVGRRVLHIKDYRAGQAEALEHILDDDDVLAVMPTGSGKSLLYQLPSIVSPGVTVVVSPLIALIKDQIDKMAAKGVAVARIDSTLTTKQRREMDALVHAPGGKLLLTTPERMADPEFRVFLKGAAGKVGVSRFVVDEAHCVSQWGHDFRPAYLSLRKAIEDVGSPPVLATTATAPPHVRADIQHQLGLADASIVTTTFDRPNLHYEVIPFSDEDEKMRTLVTLLKKLPKPGIVYCATVKKVEELHEALTRWGIPVAKYHGRMNKNERTDEQERFMASKDLVMVATNAFGLGVDKPDIRNVLHYHVPGSLEAYAQEAGRGGRDGKPTRCVLLFSPDDVAIQEYFLSGTYPTRRQVRAVFEGLEAFRDSLSSGRGAEDAAPTVANIAMSSGVGQQRTRTVLNLLKDERFIVEEEGGLFHVADPPPDDMLLNERAKQYEARRIMDRQRLDSLLAYVKAPGCRNQVILKYLGETDPYRCGRCDNCLRSKAEAEAAASQAQLLGAKLTRLLDEESSVEPASKPRRIIRARVVRIDQPAVPAAAAPAPAPARPSVMVRSKPGNGVPTAPLPPAPATVAVRRRPQAAPPPPRPTDVDEDLDETTGELETRDDETITRDGEARPARPARPAVKKALGGEESGDSDAETLEDEEGDDDELEDDELAEGEEGDDDEFEDDDEDGDDEEGDDEEGDDDAEEYEVIDKTAAELAEEGVEGNGEITILARKRVPKVPKPKTPRPSLEKPKTASEARRRRRRRRRKRRSMLPPKSAFVTPVLSTAAPMPETQRSGRPSAGGPVIEYVRGPMRINSAPVASATPNDPGTGKRKKRRPGGPRFGYGGGDGAMVQTRSGGAPSQGGQGGQGGSFGGGSGGERPLDGEGKRRRRRRRRKRGPGMAADGAVSFFSPTGSGGPSNGGPSNGGPSNGGPPSGPPNGSGGNGNGAAPRPPNAGQGDSPPAPRYVLGPDGQPLLGPDGQPLRKRRRRRRRGRGGRGPRPWIPGGPNAQGAADGGGNGEHRDGDRDRPTRSSPPAGDGAPPRRTDDDPGA